MIKSIRKVSLYLPCVWDYYFIANDGTFFRRLKNNGDGWKYWDVESSKYIAISKEVKSAMRELTESDKRFVSIRNRIYVLDTGEVLDKRYLYTNPGGYYEVSMSTLDGGVVHKRLHQLVGMCFLEGYTYDCIVHHKDRNKLNNDSSNLEILSRSEHVMEHIDEMEKPPHEFTYKSVVLHRNGEDLEILGSIKTFTDNNKDFSETGLRRLLKGTRDSYKGWKVKSIEFND